MIEARRGNPRAGDPAGPPGGGAGVEGSRWIIIGTFSNRTRAWKAVEEGVRLLALVGVSAEERVPQDIPAPTTKFVRFRLSPYDRVTQAVVAFRAQQFWSALPQDDQPIWAARARPRAEQIRVAPFGRAVRVLRTFAEHNGARWKLESVHRPRQGAISMPGDGFECEECLLRRNADTAIGQVNPATFEAMGLSEMRSAAGGRYTPALWLASLL